MSLRNLMARKVRLALSAFAIVLGVAFVAGSFIFTDSLSSAFDGIVKGTTADVVVQPIGAGDVQALGRDTRTIPASTVAELGRLPGAAAVAGSVEVQGVYVIGADGRLVGGNGPPGLAFNYTDMTAITGDPIVRLDQGRLPTGTGEIALDVDAARKAGYRVGDVVTLVTPGAQPTMKVRLVGVVGFGSQNGLMGATLTVFDRHALQSLFFGGRDVYTSVSLTTAPGVSQSQLRDAVAAVLPPGTEALTGDQYAHDTQASIDTMLGFINTFLLVFAAVAMVVGTFLIVNTFSILVAQRSRELALLRAMGASRGQVDRSVLAEALLVALVGSTVGLALGYLLAIGLKALFGVIGLDLGHASLPVEPRTVVVSYAVGVVVTLVAAYLPARRAGRVAPVAAMGDDAVVVESSMGRRLVVGGGLIVGGALATGGGLRADGNLRLALLGLGMVAVLVGVSLTAAFVGRPVIVGLGSLFRRTSGVVGTLATENSLRNPRRTAITASALMVGLTLVTLMSILGQSAKASTDRAIDATLSADLIVSNATGQFFSPAYGREIRDVPGVASVAPVRTASAKLDGSRIYVDATDPAALGSALHVSTVSGSIGGLGARSVLLKSSTASSHGLSVGDRVTLTFPSGDRTFRVGGTFPTSGGAINQDVLMTLAGLKGAGIQPQDSLLFITKQPGASESTVRAAIDRILADNPTVTLKNQNEFAAEQRGLIDTFLYLIYALLGLAVLIAVLGITNTLALSVIERTREIGLLRVVGLSRRQLRSMIRLEAVTIAVLGALLGVALGLGFGAALQHAVASQGIDVLSVPWGRLTLFVVLAVVVGVLAALVPARRAAGLDILRAIGHD